MENTKSEWTPLYRTGAIAALVAAVLFRRNIGAEVSLFTGLDSIPQSATDWFSLLQSNPFVGLSFLAVFDLVNYFLVGIVFLALAARLWSVNKNLTAMALASGLVGIAVNFSTNISLSMLSLSQQSAESTSAVQKSAFLSAGQAILTIHDPLAVIPSTGACLSLLLIALAEKNRVAAVFEQQENRPALTDIGRRRIIVKRAACRVKRFLAELHQVDHALNRANGRTTASAKSRMRPCFIRLQKT